ncbi:MAG: hypothetical protein ACLRQF_07840 [Thomasclavelia ramosa]
MPNAAPTTNSGATSNLETVIARAADANNNLIKMHNLQLVIQMLL